MTDLNSEYLYEVVVMYTIEGAILESFLEDYKFKPDKYVMSVARIERPTVEICCPEEAIAMPPCPICGSKDPADGELSE